ncbi:MAG TPA: GNAT family N-acetyltransferase [Myxococcales bacterium]|nr:GNAT family N-acetyltransferase [Myxococcales bacterium]
MRELTRSDLPGAAEFCERARAIDPCIEPFAEQLARIADGPRALLDLWRVAEDSGAIEGIAFIAIRAPRHELVHAKADLYAAVAPRFRRRGIGTELCAPALHWAALEGATLRARVDDRAPRGQAFLRGLGFRQTSAVLMLTWSRQLIESGGNAFVRVREMRTSSLSQFERLCRDAWDGEADGFVRSTEELARLSGEAGRIILVAESDGRDVGYLSGTRQARTLVIDEVAVLPDRRRRGIGRALLRTALREAGSAVLSVGESNGGARALYGSLGFTPSSRRLVYELHHG